jgi:hypothetical protein
MLRRLAPLLNPTRPRVLGAVAGPVAVAITAPAFGLAHEFLGSPEPVVVLAGAIIALGIGWLVGPLAAKRGRWSVAGAAIAAAFLGALVGAFVLAAYSSTIWADSVGQAVLQTLGLGVIGFVLGAGPVMLASVPAIALWVLLVQGMDRLLTRGQEPEGVPVEEQPSRQRVPSKRHRARFARP